MPDGGDITAMLEAASRGDQIAAEQLLPRVYDELRQIARARMRHLSPAQTLQPTALVNEAYLRLVGGGNVKWENRAHFFFAAARAMRDILVEAARRKSSAKRGGAWRRVDPAKLAHAIAAPADDMLALDEALSRLETESQRQHDIVLLRFFAGLTAADTALALGVSESTLAREWRVIRARLHRWLTESPAG